MQSDPKENSRAKNEQDDCTVPIDDNLDHAKEESPKNIYKFELVLGN
jgi:hypothetical protein